MSDSNNTAFKTAIRTACSNVLPMKQLKVFGVVCLEKDKEKEQTLKIDININNNEEVGAGQSQSVEINHRVSADTTELSTKIWMFAKRLISYKNQLKVFGIIYISHRTTEYYITLNDTVGDKPVTTGSVKRSVGQTIEEIKTVTEDVIPPKGKKLTKNEDKEMQDKSLCTGSVKRNVSQKTEAGKQQPVTKDVYPTHIKKPTQKEYKGTQDKPFRTESEQTVNKQEKKCNMGNRTFISPKLKEPDKKFRLQTEHGLIEGSEDTMQFVHVHDESKTAETGRNEYGDYSTTITTPSRPVAATNVNMKRKSTSHVEQVGATIGKKIKQERSGDMNKFKLTCRKCKKKILYSKKCMIKHIKVCANVCDQDALGYIIIG
ncbi:hypothetical protein MAR_027175 [Mya arenaria]|uniref:Uncharacterized protein n=1 Tax=Mya arenaria TaxID=6604 RepID=A0ABY7ESN8_MYAAR|nr:uncharacterized protein LOC128242520 [Mya arenaria]XP_052815656.1 uncharacterized protein LOC128242520 [Mya arenaria]WAR12995.1 hypothetical protein MAR_027175 [Mya arenaria]